MSEELHRKNINCEHHSKRVHERLSVAMKELHEGICYTQSHNHKSVTFFGSARFNEDNHYYQKARELASRIVKETGYSIVTGGGGGIMEAASRGAKEAGGHVVGFTIELPKEQATNKYVDDEIFFHYFFTRKVSLVYSAEAFVYFPGGFGTLDEFFEVMTLVQNYKIAPTPIIMYGTEYWKHFDDIFKNVLLKEGTISEKDLDIYTITDDMDEILDIIKNADVRYGAQEFVDSSSN